MTVNLTRIYTKLGDSGETHLGDMSRVSKLHPRVEAYGTVDELNATLGVALLQPGLPERIVAWLQRVQNDLLDLGADLSVPARQARAATAHSAGRPTAQRQAGIGPDCASAPRTPKWLEQACDEVNEKLPPLRSFVIPGGTPAAAHLHVCRTVCRRAERRTIAVGEEVNPEVVRYLNRLSDLLFILAAARPTSPPGISRDRSPCGTLARHGADGRWERQGSPSAVSRERARWRSAQRRRHGQRHPQRAHQITAQDIARQMPGEQHQRDSRQPAREDRRTSAASKGTQTPGATSTWRTGRALPSPRCRRGPLGHEAAVISLTPIRAWGWASSGLSVSAVSGARPSTSPTASATCGRRRQSATAISRMPQRMYSPGSSRCSRALARSSTRGPPSRLKSYSATASFTCVAGTSAATTQVSASATTHSPATKSAVAALGGLASLALCLASIVPTG